MATFLIFCFVFSTYFFCQCLNYSQPTGASALRTERILHKGKHPLLYILQFFALISNYTVNCVVRAREWWRFFVAVVVGEFGICWPLLRAKRKTNCRMHCVWNKINSKVKKITSKEYGRAKARKTSISSSMPFECNRQRKNYFICEMVNWMR